MVDADWIVELKDSRQNGQNGGNLEVWAAAEGGDERVEGELSSRLASKSRSAEAISLKQIGGSSQHENTKMCI
jgi:hypothetical protein